MAKQIVEYLDADDNGTDSFQSLIDAKAITHTVVSSFEEYDKAAQRILQDASRIALTAVAAQAQVKDPEKLAELVSIQKFPLQNHLIIIDTITSLMLTTITDAKIGNDPSKSLWDLSDRNKYFNDPQYLTVYNYGTQSTIRRMKNFRNRGARLIVTAHEDEQTDLVTQMRKRAPQANKALYEALMGASSDVSRLMTNTEVRTNPEGQVTLPVGMRVLQIRETSEVVAKFHVDRQYSNEVPPLIIDPTMQKVFVTLHKKPSFMVIYGPPGTGKTTLALSEVEVPNTTNTNNTSTLPSVKA